MKTENKILIKSLERMYKDFLGGKEWNLTKKHINTLIKARNIFQ